MRNPILAGVLEARNLVRALQEEREAGSIGPLVVSGMLAEQLARELARGAELGAVVVSDEPAGLGAPVAIRIVAGEPSAEDDAFVRAGERAEIPVVIVQLWPQEDWRAPYVLSPFVVECEAGKGFPIDEIAGKLALAADEPIALASRLPVLEEAAVRMTHRHALLRSAFVGATLGPKGTARPILALEQVGLIARLRTLDRPRTGAGDQMPVVAGTAAATIAASFAFRYLGRSARRVLPGRLADVAVATGGTWALAELVRRLHARGLV